MEVGRIVAKVQADTAEYEKKMAGAQRTFEQTGTKMAASASRVSATVQKAYTDRIVAANAAASKEIEAAQRTMRARIQASQSTVEINAARKMYDQRVAIARKAAQQEIALAQQTYLAASQGMRPVLTVMDGMTKSAARAGPGLNSVRSAMTSMAQSALHLAPGIGQVGSVLGSLALGSGVMIGVMAGLAALSFIWKKLTEDAKKLKEETVKALEAIEKLGEGPTVVLVKHIATLNEALEKVNEQILKNQDIIAKAEARGAMAQPAVREALSRDLLERARLLKAIQDAEAEKDRLNAAARLAREKEIAAVRAAALRELFFEEKTLRDSILQPLAKLGALRLPSRNVRAIQAGKPNLPSFGTIRAVEPLSAAGKRAAAGPSFLSGLGGQLKGMLDPKMILSGLATGGLTMAIGAVTGAVSNFVGNMLSAGKRAREAARAMQLAVAEWAVSLDRAIANLRGDSAMLKQLDALDAVTALFNQWQKALGGSKPLPGFTNLLDLIAFLEKEMAKQTEAWRKSHAGIEFQKLIDIAKELGLSLGDAASAANAVSAALTNVPEGFKIALARFNATTGVGAMTTSSAVPRAGNVFNGDIHVYGVENPKDFLAKLETEVIRKKLTGGGGLTLDFA